MSWLWPQSHWGAGARGTAWGEPVGSAIHQRMRDCIQAGSDDTSAFTLAHWEIIVYRMDTPCGSAFSRAETQPAASDGEAHPGSMSRASACGSDASMSTHITCENLATSDGGSGFGPSA